MNIPQLRAVGMLAAGCCLAGAQTTYQIDFGLAGPGQSTTAIGWNNMENATVGANPDDITAIVDSTGTASGIDLTYTESGGNAGVSGTGANYPGPYPAAIASLPAEALLDGLYYQKGVKITLILSKLPADNSYDFLIYGSRGNNGGKAHYTATGIKSDTGTISTVFNNATETISFTGITPKPDGTIEILLEDDRSGGLAPSGALNLMVITETLPPDDDNDGMSNQYETDNGTDPNIDDADLDKDGDGLTNIQEYRGQDATGTPTGFGRTLSGTPDSDGDGAGDGVEVSGALNPWDLTGAMVPLPGAPTDPLDPDSDDDTLNDGDEILTHGTDPHEGDSDLDDLPDAYEVAHGLDPLDWEGDNGDQGDPDDDGLTNLEEYDGDGLPDFFGGTHPKDPDSDDDGLNDGDEIFTWFTDPLVPDTDGDRLTDGDEVNTYSTSPDLADSDGDGFNDFVEITAGSDPNLATSVPTFPAISWSVAEFNSPSLLSLGGTLLYAQNFNGLSTTANTIKFDGRTVDGNDKSSEHILTNLDSAAADGTIYDDEVPEFSGLLESFWWGADPGDGQVVLTGLTPGKNYLVQFGRADDRATGNIPGRHTTADDFGGETGTDPIGATNTIYGGPDHPALLFTGTFTATSEFQGFLTRNFLADGGGFSSGAIAFIQVRDLQGGTALTITAAGFNGDHFEVTAAGLDTGTQYRLVRSANLGDGFPTVVDGPRTPAAGTDVFTDTAPPAGTGFYRMEEAPAP